MQDKDNKNIKHYNEWRCEQNSSLPTEVHHGN